ncbi:unnamed protein product [Haemonchus placei]|uniref:Transposase n=1 Tax=Haemonchus placei TaxID=6290 RepID=A0A0N4WXN8_HAEPC|nr:unnamed protein product [Haemonchus placei]
MTHSSPTLTLSRANIQEKRQRMEIYFDRETHLNLYGLQCFRHLSPIYRYRANSPIFADKQVLLALMLYCKHQ